MKKWIWVSIMILFTSGSLIQHTQAYSYTSEDEQIAKKVGLHVKKILENEDGYKKLYTIYTTINTLQKTHSYSERTKTLLNDIVQFFYHLFSYEGGTVIKEFNGKLFGLSSEKNLFFTLDSEGVIKDAIPTLSQPVDFTINGNDVYIVYNGTAKVSKGDIQTKKIVKEFTVSQTNNAVVYRDGYLYLIPAGDNRGKLVVFDLNREKEVVQSSTDDLVKQNIQSVYANGLLVGGSQSNLLMYAPVGLSPANITTYTLGDDGQITASQSSEHGLFGSNANGLYLTQDGKKIIYTTYQKEIQIIDPISLSFLGKVALDLPVIAFTVDSDEKYLYALDSESNIYRVSLKNLVAENGGPANFQDEAGNSINPSKLFFAGGKLYVGYAKNHRYRQIDPFDIIVNIDPRVFDEE